MSELRFAMVGAGFWSQYQLAGWQEVRGARCVAICDRTRSKAASLAAKYSIPIVEDELARLLAQEKLDFIDIVSDMETHVPLAKLAIERGVAVICQKPMAITWDAAKELCAFASERHVPLLVHENWRWQEPIRRFKQILDSGELGTLVRGRIDYANSFPVFDNQPALKELKQLILMDIGTHILDVSRYLFGDAEELYCQTRQIRLGIAGEDVATVMIRKQSGMTVTCNMSYASKWEFDRFPQTMIAVEGTLGGASLGADYAINRFDANGARSEIVSLPKYPWAHPEYELVHTSIVGCLRNLVAGLRGEGVAETTGADNLRTLQLVFAAYESASKNAPISLRHP